jgi:pSer/pThr/pTyr-binding forkhead associated (FHA) protein/type II secretory pathway predicted ATPase ExeA
MKSTNTKHPIDNSRATLPANFLFVSKGQTAARDALGGILSKGFSFVAISGPPGSGKTTLLDQFSQYLTNDITLAKFTGYQNSAESVLYEVLTAFKQDYSSHNYSDILRALFNFLLEQHSKNKKPLLIIDNADSLSQESLKSFLSLSELRSEGEVLIRIVLAGGANLVDYLDTFEFGPLALENLQLVQIEPFTAGETRLYLRKRYQTHGNSQGVSFSERSTRMLHHYSNGNPQAINKLSGWALQLAKQFKQKCVFHFFVKKALKTPAWARFSEQSPAVHSNKARSSAASNSKLIPKIILFKDNQRVSEHELGNKPILLGRGPDNTINLRLPTISRRHASLTILNNQVWIKSLSNINKTYVNAKAVRNHPLNDGDIIRISNFLLLFIHDNPIFPESENHNEAASLLEEEAVEPHQNNTQTQVVIKLKFKGERKLNAPVTKAGGKEITIAKLEKSRQQNILCVQDQDQPTGLKRNTRRLLAAVAGLILLWAPIQAILFFSQQKSDTDTIEIQAKLDKSPEAQAVEKKTLIEKEKSTQKPLPIMAGTTLEGPAKATDQHSQVSESIEESSAPTSDASNNELKRRTISTATQEQLPKLIIEARKHLDRGELSLCLNLIIEGIKLDPNNSDLLELQKESIQNLAQKERKWAFKKDPLWSY